MNRQFPGSLHNHTDYSNFRLRDRINRVTDLIDYALELGHKGIAFTEHETVANAIDIENYYNKIKEKHPDFKVIRGNEIYLVRDGLTAENFDRSNESKSLQFSNIELIELTLDLSNEDNSKHGRFLQSINIFSILVTEEVSKFLKSIDSNL